MYQRLSTPFVWIITFFAVLFIYTRLWGPITFSVNSVTTNKSTTFDVTGEGKVFVKPDVAFISMGIRIQGPTVKVAQDQANSTINKVSKALKDLGVDSKDIQTISYNINPDYDFSASSQKIKGYTARTTLSVKVRNIDEINSVIDAATANGANEVSGVGFDVDDKVKAQNEAREKAVAEARKKAENASRIAGFRLGKIINYSESFGGGPEPMLLRAAAQGSTDAEIPTALEPGSTEVTVNVTLSYEIQ